MKRIWIYLILWMASVFLLASCTEEIGEDNYHFYNAGKQSFDYTENNMAAFMSFFDLSLRLNAYLSLPEDQRDAAGQRYFPGCTVTSDGSNCWTGLKGEDTAFIIHTDALPLATETAVWKIKNYGHPCCGDVTLSCDGIGKWKLELKHIDEGQWTSDARLEIQAVTDKLPECFQPALFAVSGSGKCISQWDYDGDEQIIQFEIIEPLRSMAESKYLFTRGEFFLNVKNLASEKEEPVKIIVRPDIEKTRKLQVIYHGERTEW